MTNPTVKLNGRTWKRPTQTRQRAWKQPKREIQGEDSRCAYRLETSPGRLVWQCRQPTDEGFSFEVVEVDFDAGEMHSSVGGRDCDGFTQHDDGFRWHRESGRWVHEDSEVFDAAAQRAGY